jgi:F420-dependent oxidoreductase-like protein
MILPAKSSEVANVKNLLIGLGVASGNDAHAWIDRIVHAEEAGVQCAWLNNGPTSIDALVVFGAAASKTRRILFGTSIMMTFPRHPLSMAQAAVCVDQLAPGRLRLGVGPSHKPFIEGIFGMPFDKPQEHLREYLTILRSLLSQGSVSFRGKRLGAQAALSPPQKTGVKVFASALRPNGFGLCGELADGAISWMCPLPYLRDVAAPALRAGALAAGREAPPLVGHVMVCVSDDTNAVREAARGETSYYPHLPYYAQMLLDAGYPEVKDGRFSDRMIDDLVVHGTAEQVKARLRELPSFGVNELLARVIEPKTDHKAYERTVRVLGELAAE